MYNKPNLFGHMYVCKFRTIFNSVVISVYDMDSMDTSYSSYLIYLLLVECYISIYPIVSKINYCKIHYFDDLNIIEIGELRVAYLSMTLNYVQ